MISDFVRIAIRRFLEGQPGFDVCGEAVDGLDALEKARFLLPDLIILDLTMPRMNGFQAARELRAMKISASTLVTSATVASGLGRLKTGVHVSIPGTSRGTGALFSAHLFAATDDTGV